MRDFWGFFNQKFSSIKDLGAIGYADIIGLAITSLFWLYLSNLMDVDEYGKLHYFISIASIAYLISLIGSPYVITVYTAKKIKIQSTLFLISILIGAVAAACVFIFTNKLEISILIIAYIINELAINYLLGKKLFVNYSKYIVIQKTLLVTLGFGFFYFFGLDGIIYGFALSYFHLMIIIIKIYRESKVDITKLKDHRGFIVDNYIMSLANSFRQHLDKIIIAPLLGFSLLGNYSLALQIFGIMTVFESIMFKYTLTHDASGNRNFRLKKYALLLSIGISIIGIIILPIIIPTIFPQYDKVVDSIRIISIAVVSTTLVKIFISKFLGMEKSRYVLYGRIISLITMITGILILGPMYDIIGVSISFVLSSALYALTLYIFDRKISKENLEGIK